MLPYPGPQEVRQYYEKYLDKKRSDNPAYLTEGYWESFCREKDLTLGDLQYPVKSRAGKALLDVGCAVGQFLRYMQGHGLKVSGIDVSEELVASARKHGLDCSTRSLWDISGTFGVMSMWHVIEHVEDPMKYLARVHAMLEPEGDFLIETPCTGVISDAFGENWRFLMPVEHIHLFSQDGLFRALTTTGFSVRNWVRFGSGNDSGTIPAVPKQAADRVAKRLGIGDTIAVWCQKA
jgi:SAM-dependent methyltransferase